MSGINRMTGTVWHIERFERAEGDERRHRSRCVNYQGKKGFCNFYNERCRGSAHCMRYKEKELQKEIPIVKNVMKNVPFKGVKKLIVSNIVVDQLFANKSHYEKKADKIVEYYKKHGELPQPIVVSIENGQYKIAGKYNIFFAAKKLGLQTIPAEMGTAEEIENRNALRRVGTQVWVKKYNEVGSVIKATYSRVTIKCDDGKEGTYDIELALKNGSIRVIK